MTSAVPHPSQINSGQSPSCSSSHGGATNGMSAWQTAQFIS
jgi:hypothetical protein